MAEELIASQISIYSDNPLLSQDDRSGWLVISSSPTQLCCIDTPELIVGRFFQTCDLEITEKMFESIDHNLPKEDYVKISRQHFKIIKKRGDSAAVLEDLSMNGTWVDGVPVGRGNRIILKHCSIISILDPDVDCFRYLDRDTINQTYPECAERNYLVAELLGSGHTSVVHLAYKPVDGRIKCFALKMIKAKKPFDRVLKNAQEEMKIMTRLSHPCILKFQEMFLSPDQINIVMEYAAGGELFTVVRDKYLGNHLTERLSKVYFYQIVHCVHHLHKNQVCHRDLKLENILMSSGKKLTTMKVVDFGFSKSWKKIHDPLVSYVGTPVYMAPEVIMLQSVSGVDKDRDCYSYKIDCWALGVILYTMLSGRRPFLDEPELSAKVRTGEFRPMTGGEWRTVSTEAKHLVKNLLRVDPDQRFSTQQVLDHSWFTNDEAAVNMARKIMFGNNSEEDYYKTVAHVVEEE